VIAQIERMADTRDDDSAGDKHDKLITLLEQTFENIDPFVSLFAALLSIPDSGRFTPRPADSKHQKDQTLAALVGLLDGIAKRKPTLIVVEDAHWIDPTSLEWLKLIIDWIPRARALLILTSRPVAAGILAGMGNPIPTYPAHFESAKPPAEPDHGAGAAQSRVVV
jgi:predicted ATPase